jgi:hypothetical protein
MSTNMYTHTEHFSELLAANPEVLGSISELPIFLRSNGSGTGYTQPREDK